MCFLIFDESRQFPEAMLQSLLYVAALLPCVYCWSPRLFPSRGSVEAQLSFSGTRLRCHV